MLNEFCLFELILCVFESCQVGLPGLKQYLEEINVSCSRTQTAAVSQVRLEPVTLRSRVKHSKLQSLTRADTERFVIGGPNLTSCFINIFS